MATRSAATPSRAGSYGASSNATRASSRACGARSRSPSTIAAPPASTPIRWPRAGSSTPSARTVSISRPRPLPSCPVWAGRVSTRRTWEFVVYRGGRLERRHHFRYEIEPEAETRDFDPAAALEELESLVERAIHEAFAGADRPTFLLSGGYDSRYIFYTLLEAAGDPSRLHTVIWGENPERPGSDIWTSGRIARHHGARHLCWSWDAESIPEHFETLFRAQSGMSDYAFTHVDELLYCETLRREHGIGSMFRGDEIFGPQKPEVHDADEALERMGLYRCARAADAPAWFRGDAAPFLEAHRQRLEERLAAAPSDPAALRDTLYARERLPAFQQQLNYHRSHQVENLNPLLDLDILRFYRGVPASYRLGKRLFKELFERRFGSHLAEIPIATSGNPIDWRRACARSPALTSFVRRGLEKLPEPLDRSFFLARLEEARQGARADVRGPDLIPPERLAMRAFVLGRWLEEVSWRAMT